MKPFLFVFIVSSTLPLFIYWVGFYTFNSYGDHLGYFGIFSVFLIHVLVWSLLGGLGFFVYVVFAKHFLKVSQLPFKYLAILGLLIGVSHLLAQLNIRYFIEVIPLATVMSLLYCFILHYLVARQVKIKARLNVK